MSVPHNQSGQGDQTPPPPYTDDSTSPPPYLFPSTCGYPPPYQEPRLPIPPLLPDHEAALAHFLSDVDQQLLGPLQPIQQTRESVQPVQSSSEPLQPVQQAIEPSGPGVSVAPRLIADVEDVHVRHLFIRKIYLLLFAQFALVGFMASGHPEIIQRTFLKKSAALTPSALVLFVVLFVASTGYRACSRRWPCGLPFFFIYALSLTFMTTVLGATAEMWPVFVLASVICGGFLIVLLFSFQTKLNLTTWCGILFITTVTASVFGCAVLTLSYSQAVPHKKLTQIVYAGISALLYVAWLAIDTRMLWSNKKDAKIDAFGSDDYVHATLDLLTLYRYWRRFRGMGDYM